MARNDVLARFHPAVAEWFRASFENPTPPQRQGWPAIAEGQSTLILAPTGSGKTLTAFLWCIDRLMFEPVPARGARCRVLYLSPLKALAVDVERNLRAPLAGIANRAAARGDAAHAPSIAIRTGDTPAVERARFQRDPADILITTPESFYLLLTSNAREALRYVDTVIIDEIHALVPTKRGAHLAVSLERLDAIRAPDAPPMQRIGLSATQRPLDEVARFLGGTTGAKRERSGTAKPKTKDPDEIIHDEFGSAAGRSPTYRPVTVVETSARKELDLRIEVPVEDMAALGQQDKIPSGPAARGMVRPSIWSAIHPQLLALIKAHTSTLIFVNSRRIAERLASALNELAGETLVRSHHGSLARPQRIEVEDRLKAGQLRGLVATSSLELGIDMGAIDLVVQIEAPPSVASGMQRIGRAGHTIGAASRGVIVPKFRGDLVACAAVTRAMHEARIESSRYPRNPLDVLAQQIVATVSMDSWNVDQLFTRMRQAAPFADLSRSVFDSVLDMLSGRYPSDDFADLRPRLTWDRLNNVLTAREGAKRIAVSNGGTIPDRGLYGVFLSGERGPGARVGELDEEMVFESRVGETFLLGASTWRIEQITHDRVIVSPAPGEPGKMPFWRADAAGRPLELGRHIGEMVRSLQQLSPPAAIQRLVRHHDLDEQAAENLLRYLADQSAAAGAVPDDRTILVERCRDDLGDWRVCVLSPFGARIHAPWAMAAVERARTERGVDAETMWTDDGFVLRFPETDEPPDTSLLIPSSDEVEALVLKQLGGTALFAAKFREAAGRALLLPKRRPGGRTPLWQQRKRAADLLAVAARFGSFPMILEAYREILRDVFDMPALVETLRRIERREVKTITVDSSIPSPFASSLLFGYVANYLYDGDAPLAERRAQALAIDQAQLRELLGEAELRELLDSDAISDVESQLQQLAEDYRAKTTDGVHDMLLRLGDLTSAELAARSLVDAPVAIDELTRTRRVLPVNIAGQSRLIPIEYASRYRDALGVPLPPGLPETLLEPAPNAAHDLGRRYARTHAPFTTTEFASRYGLGRFDGGNDSQRAGRCRPPDRGRIPPGRDRPRVVRSRHTRVDSTPIARENQKAGRAGRTSRARQAPDHVAGCRQAARRTRCAARHDREPARCPAAGVDPGIRDPAHARRSLQPRRPRCADGGRRSRVVRHRASRRTRWTARSLPDRSPPAPSSPTCPRRSPRSRARDREAPREERRIVLQCVARRVGRRVSKRDGGRAVESRVAGAITNDTFHALRAFTRPPERRSRRPQPGRSFRSRRVAPPSAEGRWSLVSDRVGSAVSPTEAATALAQQLLSRYGVLTREVAAAENVAGGFSAVYDVLKAMEDSGRIRRGYFVAGVGATQFALPAALDLLRSLRDTPETPEVVVLSATDPANPYGTILRWPQGGVPDEAGRGPTRTVGALVIMIDGTLAAYISRGARQLLAWLPEDEPARSANAKALASTLASLGTDQDGRLPMLIAEINGVPSPEHPLASYLVDAGFSPSAMGYQMRRHA